MKKFLLSSFWSVILYKWFQLEVVYIQNIAQTELNKLSTGLYDLVHHLSTWIGRKRRQTRWHVRGGSFLFTPSVKQWNLQAVVSRIYKNNVSNPEKFGKITLLQRSNYFNVNFTVMFGVFGSDTQLFDRELTCTTSFDATYNQLHSTSTRSWEIPRRI